MNLCFQILIFNLLSGLAFAGGLHCIKFVESPPVSFGANRNSRTLRATNRSFEPVRQCHGTCYAEVGIAAIENHLALTHGQYVAVSRPDLLNWLALERIDRLVEEMGGKQESPDFERLMKRVKVPLEEGAEFTDFLLSRGKAQEALDIASRRGVLVFMEAPSHRAFGENMRISFGLDFINTKYEEYRLGSISFARFRRQLIERFEKEREDLRIRYSGQLRASHGDRALVRVNLKSRQVSVPTDWIWHEKIIGFLESRQGLILRMPGKYFREFEPGHDRGSGEALRSEAFDYFVGYERGTSTHVAYMVGAYLEPGRRKLESVVIRNTWDPYEVEFEISAKDLLRRRHSLYVVE